MSTEAKDFILQLLDRNPGTRLGGRGQGASEVCLHPWFAKTDWPGISDHRVDPPITPYKNFVNAEESSEIHGFGYNDEKLDESDHAHYKNFYHVMSHQWQDELLEAVFPMMMDYADKTEKKALDLVTKMAVEPEIKFSLNGSLSNFIFCGFVKQKVSGLFGGTFENYRHLHLFVDRLEIRKQLRQPPILIIKLSTIESMEEVIPKKLAKEKHAFHTHGKHLKIVLKAEPPKKSMKLEFRAMHLTDHNFWKKFLDQTPENQAMLKECINSARAHMEKRAVRKPFPTSTPISRIISTKGIHPFANNVEASIALADNFRPVNDEVEPMTPTA